MLNRLNPRELFQGTAFPESKRDSWFKTRHTIFALFQTWEGNNGGPGPILVQEGIVRCQVSKSLTGTGRWSMSLVPDPTRAPLGAKPEAGGSDLFGAVLPNPKNYLDLIRPNDWVWIFAHPGDPSKLECLMIGLVDRINEQMSIDESGERTTMISISGSSWEKVLERTAVVSDWTLFSLKGPPNFVQLLNKFLPLVAAKTPLVVARTLQAFLSISSEDPVTVEDILTLANTSRPQIHKDAITDLVNELAGTDSRIASVSKLTTNYKGQLEIPGTDSPLWNFLQLEFEPIHEYQLCFPQNWIGSLGFSVKQFIEALSNPPMNELFFDVRNLNNNGLRNLSNFDARTAGDWKRTFDPFSEFALADIGNSIQPGFGTPMSGWVPHVILRRRPLFLDELMDLGIAEVPGDDEIIEIDIGYSDTDLINVATPSFGGVGEQFTPTLRMTKASAYFDSNSVRRHGLRWYSEEVTGFPVSDSTSPQFGGSLTEAVQSIQSGLSHLEEIQKRLFHAHRFNDRLGSGTVTFRRMIHNAFIGGVFVRNRKARPGISPERTEVYYIDDMSYSWSYPGSMMHSLTLTRGHALDGRLPGTQEEAEASFKAGF